MRGYRYPFGMTLVELLVALALLAVAVPLAYRGLQGVIFADQHAQVRMDRWQALAFAFERLETDLAQALPRPARSAEGLQLPPWSGGPGGFEFTRAADGRPPLRLRYQLKDSGLWLMQLPVPDRGHASDPQPFLLAGDIAELRVAYLDSNGGLVAAWQDSTRLPAAVKLELSLGSGERIERFFALP